MQEFSSLLMTHLLSVMHALVNFHEYISYSLGVMARTQLTSSRNNSKTKNARVVFLVHDTCLSVMEALVKFHEYISYGLLCPDTVNYMVEIIHKPKMQDMTHQCDAGTGKVS